MCSKLRMGLNRRDGQLLGPVARVDNVVVPIGEIFEQGPEMPRPVSRRSGFGVERLKQEKVNVSRMGVEEVELPL